MDQRTQESMLGQRRSMVLCGALGIALVGCYAIAYPIRGVRIPLGSDTPVYVWWARRALWFGLADTDAGGRPVVVGLLGVLDRILPVSVSEVAAAMGPVLAAAIGLAAAAIVHVAVATERRLLVITALLTGIYLSILVPGYFSTLAAAAAFLAVIGTLTASAHGKGARPVVAAAALMTAAGLAHPRFLPVLTLLLLAGAAAATWSRLREGRSTGKLRPHSHLTTGALAVALVGAAATGGWLLAARPTDLDPVETSRDAFLRRHGLLRALRRSYRRVLHDYLPWYRVLLVVAAAAVALVPRPRQDRSFDGRATEEFTFVTGVALAWLGGTALAVLALVLGIRVPGQRLVAFALPLPALAAIGALRMHRALAGLGRTVATLVPSLALAAFIVVAWSYWGGFAIQIPADGLAQARTAAGALAARPVGTPLVVVVDDRRGAPGLRAIRLQNYIRGVVPPARVRDVVVFFGTPEDFLARRISGDDDLERELLVGDALRSVSAAAHPPMAVVLEALDPSSYRRVASRSGILFRSEVGSGVLEITGSAIIAGPDAARMGDPATEVGSGPFSPWLPLWLSPLALLVVGAVGWPWTRLTMAGGDTVVHAALAPAFGVAALGLGSVLVDAAGVRLGGAGWAIAVSVAASAWAVPLWDTLRRGRPSQATSAG